MNYWTPNLGEMIEVNNSSNDSSEDWQQRELIMLIPNSQQAYVVYENENKTIIKQYSYARPIKQAPEEIKLWDIVETSVGHLGIVTGFRNVGLVELYIPSLVLVNLFSLRDIKLRKDKVAMAPATYNTGSGGIQTTQTLFASKEDAEKAYGKAYGARCLRWPHSIASMTIEDK